MSLRRSASGGNLRSSSPNVSKTSSQKARLSARSSQGSDVSDFLYVSPMKQNSKQYTKDGTPKTKTVKNKDSKPIKPKITQSLNLPHNGSTSGRLSAKRPAWSMKQPVDDTPRSEISSTSTFNLPTRPSIDDFLDFQDLSPDQYVSDKMKTDVNMNGNRKSLLEFLSEDTPRTDFSNDHKNFLHDSLKSKSNADSLENKLIIEDISDQANDEIASWSSGSNKNNIKKQRTTSLSSRSSENSKQSAKSATNSSLFNSKKQKSKNNYEHSKQKAAAHFSGNVKVRKSQKNPNVLNKEKAAKIIQLWWHKVRIRNTAGRAAMERMMENKRLEIEKRLAEQHRQEYQQQVHEFEQVKQKEQKARIARQKIIDEMHSKRNGNLKPKAKLKTQKYEDSRNSNPQKKSKKVPEILEFPDDPRPTTASSVGRKVDEIFELSSRGSNSSFSPRVVKSPPLPNDDDAASTLVSERPQGSRKTYDDLLNTLKELEDDPIEFRDSPLLKTFDKKDQDFMRNSVAYLKENDAMTHDEKPSPNSFLSADKLKTIMSFLDEVEKVEDDVRSEVLSQSRDFYPAPQIITEEEISPAKDSMISSASQVASDISNAITAHKLEIDEKKRTVDMMKKALDQQKEFTTIQIREMDKEQKQQLAIQRQEYEATIQRHLSFIDQLIDDKKVLTQRCEDLVVKLKEMDQKYSTKIKQMTESHAVELKKQKEIADAAEKIRREKWIKDKTQEIKEMTVKGLEPDIQKLIAKHKAEIKKIKAMKQGEILEVDERVGRKYIQQIEQLRNELEKEKEMAVRKERENARLRFEDQLREEENQYQQQRRRLYNEIEEEKERLNEQIQNIKKEYEEKRQAYETSSKQTLSSAIKDYEKQLADVQRVHEAEMKNYKEQVDIEKQQWIENYMKKQDTHLLTKERELKEGVRDARDKEIEMVIARLEQETALNREEAERAAENRIKRIRDKYENEMKELERSERSAHDKCTAMKERVEDMENECIQARSNAKQKQQELEDLKKITDRLQEERGKVSDIIRQEFADRLVALEEESKRLRNELHEEKSRHRFDVERITKDKEDEMDEVHKRVKKAIAKKEETTQLLRQQMLAAEKRAEHLEQLLAEQRKKILSK